MALLSDERSGHRVKIKIPRNTKGERRRVGLMIRSIKSPAARRFRRSSIKVFTALAAPVLLQSAIQARPAPHESILRASLEFFGGRTTTTKLWRYNWKLVGVRTERRADEERPGRVRGTIYKRRGSLVRQEIGR